MTVTRCMVYLLGAALCLHYSFAVSVPVCPASACNCPHATWNTSSNGCRRCSCPPKPIVCPKLNCLHRICPGGYATQNNCPTCRCKLPPVCPYVAAEVCTNGTVIDKNGCTVCRNNTVPCKVRLCPAIFCPDGYVKDANGCDTCECKQQICPQIGCPPPDYCESEYFRDKAGCMKCGCRCPEPICPTIKCAFGLATNSSGCRICQCKPYACPDIMCTLACPVDFERDERGCQICRCKVN